MKLLACAAIVGGEMRKFEQERLQDVRAIYRVTDVPGVFADSYDGQCRHVFLLGEEVRDCTS